MDNIVNFITEQHQIKTGKKGGEKCKQNEFQISFNKLNEKYYQENEIFCSDVQKARARAREREGVGDAQFLHTLRTRNFSIIAVSIQLQIYNLISKEKFRTIAHFHTLTQLHQL